MKVLVLVCCIVPLAAARRRIPDWSRRAGGRADQKQNTGCDTALIDSAPSSAALLGGVGYTALSTEDAAAFMTQNDVVRSDGTIVYGSQAPQDKLYQGEDIFGPFENGFTCNDGDGDGFDDACTAPDTSGNCAPPCQSWTDGNGGTQCLGPQCRAVITLSGTGQCAAAKPWEQSISGVVNGVFIDDGYDTLTAEAVLSATCSDGDLIPRLSSDGTEWLSLLDYCGGHTRQYHLHEKLWCLYDRFASGHSTLVGYARDGQMIYGANEGMDSNGTPLLPQLDACGGHFGVTPDSMGQIVYHYHMQANPPFSPGCYGPDPLHSTGLVTVAKCRSLYQSNNRGCQSPSGVDDTTTTLSLRHPDGSTSTKNYDSWCPCFDANGNNDPANIVERPVISNPAVNKNNVRCRLMVGTVGSTDQQECVSGNGAQTGTAAGRQLCCTEGTSTTYTCTQLPFTCATVDHGTCTACTSPLASSCTAVTCDTGYADSNGVASDGCEAAVVGGADPTSTPQPTMPTTPPSTTSTKPNLLVFQPDDLPFYWSDGPTLPSSMNAPRRIPTPHLDQLRSESAIFTRAYTTSPMCAPSRFSVVTGRYPSRSGHCVSETNSCGSGQTVADVTVPKSKLDQDLNHNLQRSLKAAGYTTGVVGKWHLAGGQQSYTPTSTAYPAMTARATATGFDFVDGFYTTNLDNWCTNGVCADTLGFSHNMEWVTAKAIEFITSSVSSSTPFFLYMNPTIPHSPSSSEALVDISVRNTPSGVLTADPVSNMPARQGDSTAVYERAVAAGGQINGAVSAIWLDDSWGSIHSTLSSLSVLDQTCIVFVTDHGNEGKSTLYETGGRIAMSFRYPPAFTGGSTYSSLVSNLDIGATFIHLATGTPPSPSSTTMDGTSLLLLPDDSQAPMDRTLHLELGKARAVVTRTHKYINTRAGTYPGSGNACSDSYISSGGRFVYYPGASDQIQMYDLVNDPAEQTNIASDPAHSSTLAQLSSQLQCHLDATSMTASPSYGSCGEQDGVWLWPNPTPTPSPTVQFTVCTGNTIPMVFLHKAGVLSPPYDGLTVCAS